MKISIFVIIRGSNSGREIPFDPDYVNIQLLMLDNFFMKFRECYLLSVSYNMHIYLKTSILQTSRDRSQWLSGRAPAL